LIEDDVKSAGKMADGIESLKKPPLENDPVGSSTTVMKDASKSEFLGKEAELQAQAKNGDTKYEQLRNLHEARFKLFTFIGPGG
jgi:hypothetical protein